MKLADLTDQQRNDILASNSGILTEIAIAARVSISTVSRTFRGLNRRRTNPHVVRAIEARLPAAIRAANGAAEIFSGTAPAWSAQSPNKTGTRRGK